MCPKKLTAVISITSGAMPESWLRRRQTNALGLSKAAILSAFLLIISQIITIFWETIAHSIKRC